MTNGSDVQILLPLAPNSSLEPTNDEDEDDDDDNGNDIQYLSCRVPGTMLSEAQASFHQILTTALEDQYYPHPHCTDEEAEA